MKFVNKLKIPALLEQLIIDGKWSSEKVCVSRHRIFGDGGNISLYGIDQIRRETRHMLDDYDYQVVQSNNSYGEEPYKLDSDPFWFGLKGKGVFPGDLDMTQAILIGSNEMDLGIVLDYRENHEEPRVLISTYGLLWEETHSNIECLAKDLRILS